MIGSLDLKEATLDIIRDLDPYPDGAGLMVGILHQEQDWFGGYGSARDLEEESGPSTLFEIGSLTKVFTTALLAICAQQGLMELDDPLRRHLPDVANLPETITLKRLASHTAGLPNMPPGSMWLALRHRRDPFASVTSEDVLRYCRRLKARAEPAGGFAVRYSSLGLTLLGYALASRLKLTYEEAIRKIICKPLGMVDTCIRPLKSQLDRVAAPHSSNGQPAHAWNLGAYAGAGALRSTAADLLAFLGAHLSPRPGTVGEAFQICHEMSSDFITPIDPVTRVAGRFFGRPPQWATYLQGMALGWEMGRLRHDNQTVWWRQGATGGFRAFAGFVKAGSTGVVVLSNSGLRRREAWLRWTTTNDLGFRLLEFLAEK